MSHLPIAFFVSPHGYGHAARAAALIEALASRDDGLEPHLFTAVPRWFFDESLSRRYRYHELVSDVGLVQRSSLEEDPAATVLELERFWNDASRVTDELVRTLGELGVRAVVADIAPLGLRVARQADLPSFLIENFTWQWIYRGYLDSEPRLAAFADLFEAETGAADHHLQVEPFCEAAPGAAHLPPVSRRPRVAREAVRAKLEIDRPAVLVTMGGFGWTYTFVERLRSRSDLVFVVPGASDDILFEDNLRLLPHHSEYYHPDLVSSVDLVVGKLGYSTVAEAYRAGVPFAYVERPRFRESEVLAEFVERELPCLKIRADEFEAASWVQDLEGLARGERRQPTTRDGAEAAAALILSALQS